jgi:chaperonin GroEL
VRKSTLEAYEASADYVAERVKEIQASYRHTKSQYDTDRLNERIAALEGGLCLMQIGAVTEAELKEKRARVEDALSAVQGALEEGVLPGGGSAYLAAGEAIRDLCPEDESFDFKAGWSVLVQALRQPLLTLVSNAGEDTRDVLYRVQQAQEGSPWMGWNAHLNTVEDFSLDYGVVDPLRVGVAVVDAAASVASLLLTSEVSILNAKR